MGYSNDFTAPASIPAPVLASPSVRRSSNATAAGSGSSPSWAADLSFVSHYRVGNGPGTDSPEPLATVLLIEDNRAEVRLLREALESHGVACELLVVDDGEKAAHVIAAIEREGGQCPDLTILDLNLPRRDGREVLRDIRGSAVCRNMSVLLLSSSQAAEDRNEAQKLGAGYITKPSTLDAYLELGGAIRMALQQR